MADQLPPGFRFADEPAPVASAPVLPEGFRFADEVPLPPRRPADLVDAAPQPADVPLPPVRPPEFGSINDDAGQFPAAAPAPANTGGVLDGILGSSGKLTPEEGRAEQEAKAAAAQQALRTAQENAARTAAAPPPIPSFSDGPPAQESEAQLADAMKGAAFDAAARAATAPPPTLTPGRAGVQTGINTAGKAAVGIAKPIGQINADLGAPQWKEAIAGAEQSIDKAFPNDPGRADETGQHVASAFGGLVPFIAGGAIAKSLGLSAEGVTAAIGALQGGGSGYEAAEAAGAGPMARYLAMFGNAGIGAAQAVPYMRMLDRVEQMAPGAITDILKSTAQTSIEQVAVQGLSKLGENGIAKLLYDKDQGLFDGVVESAQVAAIVGGVLGLGGGFYGSAAARAGLRERLERSTPDEIDAFIHKAQGGKSTREEIDDFLKEQAAKEAQSAPAEPTPVRPSDNGKAAPEPATAPPLSPEDNTAPAQNSTEPNNVQPRAPQPGDATLKAMGWGEEEIALMGAGQRATELAQAAQEGIHVPDEPTGAASERAGTAAPAASEKSPDAAKSDTQAPPSKPDEPVLPPGYTFADEPAPADTTGGITEHAAPSPPAEQPGETPSAPSAPSAQANEPAANQEQQTGTSPSKPSKAEKPRAPQTLLSFIKAAGGIKDVGGNLRAAGLHRYPGLINNKSGMDPDRAREAAAEGGYLGADRDHAHSNTTPDDLTNALLKHPTYSSFDEEQLAQWQAHKGSKEQREKDLSQAEKDIHADQVDAGVPAHLVHDHYVREGARLHVDEGVPLEDAYEQAVMRDTRDFVGDKAKEIDSDIPWEDYEEPKPEAALEDQGGKEGPSGEEPGAAETAEAGGAGGRDGEDRVGGAKDESAPDRAGPPRGSDEERETEVGAEGLPQYIARRRHRAHQQGRRGTAQSRREPKAEGPAERRGRPGALQRFIEADRLARCAEAGREALGRRSGCAARLLHWKAHEGRGQERP
jgi:hypothetical protein